MSSSFKRLKCPFFSVAQELSDGSAELCEFQSANAPLLLCDRRESIIPPMFNKFQSANAPLLFCDGGDPDARNGLGSFQSSNEPLLLCERHEPYTCSSGRWF